MGSRRLVYVRACLSLGAHILVPVGTRLEMGLPGQLMLKGVLVRSGGPCSILILFAGMPIVLGVGRVGFLPVVPSLPGCKPPATPQSWSPHFSFRSFCTATSASLPPPS